MLHWYQVWKYMRKLTGKDVEKRAVMEIINYFESLIESVIKRSIVELNELNKIRQIQGLNSKARIDQECVRRAIKVINSEIYNPYVRKTDRRYDRKREKSCKKHLIEDVFREVT